MHSLGTAFDLLLGFALHRLPFLGPEPLLVDRHGRQRVKLDYAVGALANLDLRARLVEPVAATQTGAAGRSARGPARRRNAVARTSLQYNGIAALLLLRERSPILRFRSAPPSVAFPHLNSDLMEDLAALDRRYLWHPFTQQRGWLRRGRADHRPRRGLHAARRRRPRLHRRRQLALVQRPRPPASRDRRRDPRPARPRRALDDAGPVARAGDPAGAAADRDRPRRPVARLLLRQRLDRHRDRREDGLPVPAAVRQRRGAPASSPARRLPRRHDRLGLGRRHRPLPRHLPAAAVRHADGRARRRRAICAGSSSSTATRSRR